MIRALGFLLRLFIVVALAVWLADQPGNARIVWHDYVIETSAAFLGFCIFLMGYAFYLLFRFWHLIKHGPEQWRIHRKLRKLRQGQEQLAKGLVAIAAGQASDAGRFAVQARKLLGPTAAAQLLQAQAAQLAGDYGSARMIFRALALHKESAILGYRGLIMEARRAHDWTEVDHLIGKLREAQPDLPWLNLMRLEVLARKGAWREADAVWTKVNAARLLDPLRAKRVRAALLIAAAQKEAREKKHGEALQEAERAVKLAPDWLPAIINLAEKQVMAGHARAAYRTIEKNWPRLPHPQLIAIYRTGQDDPLETFKQIERLCRGHENEPINRLALAEAALSADIWGEARRHLIALISHDEATQSAYRLMAKLERRESGNEQAALQWLTKAVDAPMDPLWLCQSCGGSHQEWAALCTHCGDFNTLLWQSPGMSRAPEEIAILRIQDHAG